MGLPAMVLVNLAVTWQ